MQKEPPLDSVKSMTQTWSGIEEYDGNDSKKCDTLYKNHETAHERGRLVTKRKSQRCRNVSSFRGTPQEGVR